MTPGRINVERLIDCPSAVAAAYMQDALRDAEHGGGAAILRAGPLRHGVTLTFGTEYFAVDGADAADNITMRWASRMSLVPDFRGTITSRSEGERTRLVLAGVYVPPGSRIGALLDSLAGRHVAAATGRDLLRKLGGMLETRYADWRHGAPDEAATISASRGPLTARR